MVRSCAGVGVGLCGRRRRVLKKKGGKVRVRGWGAGVVWAGKMGMEKGGEVWVLGCGAGQ